MPDAVVGRQPDTRLGLQVDGAVTHLRPSGRWTAATARCCTTGACGPGLAWRSTWEVEGRTWPPAGWCRCWRRLPRRRTASCGVSAAQAPAAAGAAVDRLHQAQLRRPGYWSGSGSEPSACERMKKGRPAPLSWGAASVSAYFFAAERLQAGLPSAVALLDEAGLGARQRSFLSAALASQPGCRRCAAASSPFALLQEAGLGCTGQRLAVLVARFLGAGGLAQAAASALHRVWLDSSTANSGDDGGQQGLLHASSFVWWMAGCRAAIAAWAAARPGNP
jgi:hypothetical protein